MEKLDNAISRVWLNFSTYNLMPRGRKKHLIIAIFVFAEDGSQTRDACAANKCAFHYTIASRQLKCEIIFNDSRRRRLSRHRRRRCFDALSDFDVDDRLLLASSFVLLVFVLI